jgi:hypothetical protein
MFALAVQMARCASLRNFRLGNNYSMKPVVLLGIGLTSLCMWCAIVGTAIIAWKVA